MLAVQLETARKQLSCLAKQSGQQRYAPADLDAFLASLPDCTREDPQAGPSQPQQPQQDPPPAGDDRSEHTATPPEGLEQVTVTQHPEGPTARVEAEGLHPMADPSAVPRERRGGARVKGVSSKARKGARVLTDSVQQDLTAGDLLLEFSVSDRLPLGCMLDLLTPAVVHFTCNITLNR